MNDLKYAVRTLARTPTFTAAAIAVLALGIAASTAMFSVVNAVLLKPLPYHDPERIVMFQNTFGQGGRTGSASPVEFNWWRRQTEVFEDVSGYAFSVANLTGDRVPEQIATMRVSADFFRLCGSTALLGRTFTTVDDLPNGPKTVVLTHAFWQRRFGGDPSVIGRHITVNGDEREVIGVMRPDLEKGQLAERVLVSGDVEVNEPPVVYLPFQVDPNSTQRGRSLNVAGRLKPGLSLAAAHARLQASHQEYARTWPDPSPGAGFGVRPLQEAIVGGLRSSLLMLSGAVGFVLLIACANVANLLLARAAGRKREIAIRIAIGAGRGRIVRQLLTESLMLSLVGGGLGVVAGHVGILAVLNLGPGIPRIGAGASNVELDWRVLGFTLAVSVLISVMFGLLPALQSSRVDVHAALKGGEGAASTARRHNRTRGLLVVAEMALAVVLMVGAALLIRTFIAIRQVEPGFDARNVLTMRMLPAGARFDDAGEGIRVINEALRRLRALPGVEAAGVSCCLPLEDRFYLGFQVPGGLASGGRAGFSLVSAGYFDTFKIPILRGRAFTPQDESGPPVAIINQTLAKQFWPNDDPLDSQIILGEEPQPIVGVVGDVRDNALNRDPRPIVYLLLAHSSIAGTPWAWVVRTRAAPMPLSSTIQDELRNASGGLPVSRPRTMEEVLARSTAAGDFNTMVLTIFGCAALVLAGVGIYGLMAYSVTQRTRELGIRMALGAEGRQIRHMVVRQGLGLALTGAGCGLAMAIGLTRLISGLLYGVEPWDPQAFVAAPGILVGVALVAAWWPAMRASRVDPIRALRCE